LTLQGKISDAIAECEKAASSTDDPNRLGLLGYLYGLADRKEEAHNTLEKLHQLRAQRYTLAYSVALASLGVNDKTEAITWLEQGYHDRDGENIGKIRLIRFLNRSMAIRVSKRWRKRLFGGAISRRFKMKIENFFAEPRSGANVYKVAVAYAVVPGCLFKLVDHLPTSKRLRGF